MTASFSDSSIHHEPANYQAVALSLSDGEASGLIYIELQAAASENRFPCQNGKRPYMLSIHTERKYAVLWRPDCKLWNCPGCGERNRRRVVAMILHGYQQFSDQGHNVAFLTITSHEKLDAAGSIAVWPKAWTKLRKRLARTTDFTSWFFMPELHADGRLHAHGLVVNAPVERWWKDNARACGFGYQNDRQELDEIGGAAGYAAKYSTKMLQNSNFPKGTNHYKKTANWPALPKLAADQAWNTRKIANREPLSDLLASLDQDGYEVVMASDNYFWSDLSN